MSRSALPSRSTSRVSFRIWHRLAIGFAVMLAMIVGLGVLAARDVASTAEASALMYKHPFTVTKSLATARYAAISLTDLVRNAAADKTAQVDTATKSRLVQELQSSVDIGVTAFLGPKADGQAIRDGVAPFIAGVEQAASLIAQGKREEAQRYIATDLALLANAETQSLTKVLAFANNKAAEFAARSQATASSTVQMTWIMTGGALLVGLLVTILTARGITRPLGLLRADMRQLADGDRTIEVREATRRDEIGEMGKTLVILRESLVAADAAQAQQADERVRTEQEKSAALVKMAETIESETVTALTDVSKRADEMKNTADGMSARAEITNRSAQAAAEAANDALSTVQTVASAAEELAASIREISGQMHQSTALVSQAVTAGGEARGTIEALNETVMRIGAVADMIGEIAAKTNLLALNATIEAARAGDAGKGFAVVASEVKQLAAQTARSTGEISQHINEVRAATTASVEAVGRIEETITQINAVAGSIAAAVEEQGAATAEIARSVAQTAEAANSVTSRIQDLSDEARNTGADAAHVHDTATSLASSVSELKHALVRVVRTSSDDVDRRQADRFGVDLPCHLTIGSELRVARLVDISTGGAAIRDGGTMAPNTRGKLRMAGVGFELPFVARESDDGLLHVAFELEADMLEKFSTVPERLAMRAAA